MTTKESKDQIPAAMVNRSEVHKFTADFDNTGIRYYGLTSFQPDKAVASCFLCTTTWGFFTRRHHCRGCRRLVCDNCSQQSVRVGSKKKGVKVRLCDRCVHVIKLPVIFEKTDGKQEADVLAGMQEPQEEEEDQLQQQEQEQEHEQEQEQPQFLEWVPDGAPAAARNEPPTPPTPIIHTLNSSSTSIPASPTTPITPAAPPMNTASSPSTNVKHLPPPQTPNTVRRKRQQEEASFELVDALRQIELLEASLESRQHIQDKEHELVEALKQKKTVEEMCANLETQMEHMKRQYETKIQEITQSTNQQVHEPADETMAPPRKNPERRMTHILSSITMEGMLNNAPPSPRDNNQKKTLKPPTISSDDERTQTLQEDSANQIQLMKEQLQHQTLQHERSTMELMDKYSSLLNQLDQSKEKNTAMATVLKTSERLLSVAAQEKETEMSKMATLHQDTVQKQQEAQRLQQEQFETLQTLHATTTQAMQKEIDQTTFALTRHQEETATLQENLNQQRQEAQAQQIKTTEQLKYAEQKRIYELKQAQAGHHQIMAYHLKTKEEEHEEKLKQTEVLLNNTLQKQKEEHGSQLIKVKSQSTMVQQRLSTEHDQKIQGMNAQHVILMKKTKSDMKYRVKEYERNRCKKKLKKQQEKHSKMVVHREKLSARKAVRQRVTQLQSQLIKSEYPKGCFNCTVSFGLFTRVHHCRSCGLAVCDACSTHRVSYLNMKMTKDELKDALLKEDTVGCSAGGGGGGGAGGAARKDRFGASKLDQGRSDTGVLTEAALENHTSGGGGGGGWGDFEREENNGVLPDGMDKLVLRVCDLCYGSTEMLKHGDEEEEKEDVFSVLSDGESRRESTVADSVMSDASYMSARF